MDKVEEILKQYPFIGEDIKHEQEELNNYIILIQQLKEMNNGIVSDTLAAQCIDGMPHGAGASDQTGNLATKIANGYIKLRDKYQREIDDCIQRINVLLDLKKWLDRSFEMFTEDEKRIVYLKYSERWQAWKVMQRMGITERKTYYKIIERAKEKIKKIMFT